MSPPARTPRTLRRGVLVAAMLASAGVLSACQLPDVSMSPSVATSPATSPATSAGPEEPSSAAAVREAAAPVTPTTPARPAGDLDAGSVTHVLAAGNLQLVVDWWTAEQATTWTPADEKTIQLSAHLEGGDTDGETEVLVTRFSAVLDDGTTRTSLSDDSGEFAIQPPFTYGTALSLPASPAGTSTVTVDVQFDLLVETEPGSQRYFRQTVLDSLVLPLVAPTSEENE
ncbi:hypothetical protein [Klenkia sp. PcliD-1-E]|uniref:hypothetical protein n=1 Tax=Klenkia sp. PcliD-1-E TaxID=2954492 RepID=UPI0020971A81|nr:hypothetical protein [Klenkia sp. PcliD-1-E]MCO7220262.1 hypothetical protein [Klenkia sp. PcliD-1-E]